jgi:MoxR-like ATPase
VVLDSIEEVQAALRRIGYLADRSLATSIYLAIRLEKPLLLEGEAGVGKTEVAKALATVLNARLIRLQGYEGLDIAHAVYEWNYARQLIAIRLAESAGTAGTALDVFGPEFLIERPLLQALHATEDGAPTVLLIDELDRVDDEFEAFLLEILSEYAVTIPEIGTVRASIKPIVLMTSNRTRELHDALKRRCLYHWIDYPTLEQEHDIVMARVPGAEDALCRQAVAFVAALRDGTLYKAPGVAETIDWTRALMALGCTTMQGSVVDDTLGLLLKNQEDIVRVRGSLSADLVRRAAEPVAGQ